MDQRADVLNRILERLDRLEKIGVIGEGGDIMIDAKEAAAIACVEEETIRIWGQNAKIARYKLGGAVRFGLREFCKWIASKYKPATKKAA